MNENTEDKVTTRRRQMSDAAMSRYHGHFDNDTYLRATRGKSTGYANALIDECMALCGHPRFKLSNRPWSASAREHLANFC